MYLAQGITELEESADEYGSTSTHERSLGLEILSLTLTRIIRLPELPGLIVAAPSGGVVRSYVVLSKDESFGGCGVTEKCLLILVGLWS